MTPQLIRVSSGLLAALLVAVLLKFVLFDLSAASGPETPSFVSQLGATFGYVLVYGLPLAAIGVAATEFIRLRRVAVHIALGTILALIAAHLSVRGEALTSAAFTGGALTGLSVLLIGILSSLAYWAVAGRLAGWRGNDAELADTLAAEAFRTASAKSKVDYCATCLAGRAALGILFFALFAWISIETTGLRDWLVAETEVHAKSVLRNSGYTWATFKVDGKKGIIKGLAPDEAEKRAAYDTVREALGSVTGLPGILARIDNEAVARMPMSAVSQQLADAEKREREAKVAIEAARIAAELARAAEADANRKADEQVLAREEELKRTLEDKARAAEEQLRAVQAQAQALEQARATQAQAQAQALEQARAAETQARAAEAETRKVVAPAPPAPEPQVEVAAVAESNTHEEARANIEATPESTTGGASSSPALDAPASAAAAACTSQDLALLESSRILFDMQMFEVRPGYNGELDRLVLSAQACAPRPILVTGHADINGDSLFNRALGLQRAQAVREKLIARGVPATRVIADFDATRAPIDNSQGNEARALNRRADFKFVEISEISRDATLEPDERATTCENDLSGIMSQATIYFPTASARVSDESKGLIKKLATAIGTCGSVIVTVEGHTDKIGGAGYNQVLSEARANTVREELVLAGADPTRVASRGFASNRPHDESDTAAAFALNRRIEFKVSGKFTTTSTGGP